MDFPTSGAVPSVHPTYDPVGKVWYVEATRLLAPTLSQLAAKLPPSTVIEGYWPGGFPQAMADAARGPILGARAPRCIEQKDYGQLGLEAKARRADAKAERDRSNKLWSPHEGTRGSRPGQVRNRKGPQQTYDHERLVDMWFNGDTVESIAEAIGCPKPTVSRIVSKFRDKKDPRAVYRRPGPATPQQRALYAKYKEALATGAHA